MPRPDSISALYNGAAGDDSSSSDDSSEAAAARTMAARSAGSGSHSHATARVCVGAQRGRWVHDGGRGVNDGADAAENHRSETMVRLEEK